MNPFAVIYILVSHFLGDVVFQDGAMASQKSQHLSWLILHVVIYMFVIFFMTSLGMVYFHNWSWGMAASLSVINSSTHFVIDYAMSKINAENKEKKENHLFWVGIGFEQLLHTSILIYSLYYLSPPALN